MLHNGNKWVEVGTVYVLPKASSDTLGGIKIGTGLKIDDTGAVSVSNEGMAVGSADKLTTARNITVKDADSAYFSGSEAFDGSTDITIALGLTDSFKTKLAAIDTNTTNITDLTSKVNSLATIKLSVLTNEENKTIEELVPIENRKSNIIYLVPHGDSETDNAYDEYVYIAETDKFELIATTKVDLTGYLKADTAISFLQAETRANLENDDSIQVALGKIQKFFADLATIKVSKLETTYCSSVFTSGDSSESNYTWTPITNESEPLQDTRATLINVDFTLWDNDNIGTAVIVDSKIVNNNTTYFISPTALKTGEIVNATLTTEKKVNLLDLIDNKS